MKARGEHLADTLQLLVELTRDAPGEALDATRERQRAAGFAQEMDMVREHVELDDPEVSLL